MSFFQNLKDDLSEAMDELTGAERNEWISKHSPRPFTVSDWKNAGRASRQKSILPRELVEDKLAELLA